MLLIHGETIQGVNIDPQTRCLHYDTVFDIVAIKFKCCGDWFPCFECHASEADHPTLVWPKDERDMKAVLCGACGHQLTIAEYFDCGSICPKCESRFNPGCLNHYHLYFFLIEIVKALNRTMRGIFGYFGITFADRQCRLHSGSAGRVKFQGNV